MPTSFLTRVIANIPTWFSKSTPPEGWTLNTCGPGRLQDVKNAVEAELSFFDSINNILQVEHTMAPEVAWDHYHVNVIRGKLTRNLAAIYPDVRDETIVATAENIPASEDWTEVSLLPTIMTIVGRVSNRMFVGLPLCRDKEYLGIVVNYTLQVVSGAFILRLFPKDLRSLISKLFLSTNKSYKRLRKIVEPMLQERLDNDEKLGANYDGRPNDFISWLLEIAQPAHRTIRDLTLRILVINFAAIHTTTMSVTHVLFDIAANPQYIAPLREEIEAVTQKHGWSKASLGQMRKLDSFMKESQRMWGLGPLASARRVLKDFTFSNGQVVPAGHDISFTAHSIHKDAAHYDEPHVFRPFRFSDMREGQGEGVFHQFITPDPTFVAFGIPNRHACPGRFFASTEIKGILAHLIMNYDLDVKGGVRPKNMKIGSVLSPHPTASVLIRKRRD
ncbi:cytochrome P450 [Flagelloscypha sp. PMI_526]|nr:cytochrome P450 [Flagelloscypha sp. PMI_526]